MSLHLPSAGRMPNKKYRSQNMTAGIGGGSLLPPRLG
jgi:hypothetical protein